MREFRFLLAALVLAAVVCCPAMPATDPADAHPSLHLIPWPKSLREGAGYLRITAESRIVAGEGQLNPLAHVLADEIAKLTGLKLRVTSDAGRVGDIVVNINRTIKADEQILVLRNPNRCGPPTVPTPSRLISKR